MRVIHPALSMAVIGHMAALVNRSSHQHILAKHQIAQCFTRVLGKLHFWHIIGRMDRVWHSPRMKEGAISEFPIVKSPFVEMFATKVGLASSAVAE